MSRLHHPHASRHPAGYRELVPPYAAGLHTELRVIDVREPDEYAGPLGHITGAELVPLASLAATAASWDRDRPLLVVCRSGGRSSRAAAWLAGAGFTDIINLAGGMIAWNEHGLPTCGGGRCGCRDEAA
jgi:rhodanese-related sulfurtransferase